VCDTPITGVDFLPTLAQLAGAKLPSDQPADGLSFVPLLKGNKGLTERSIFWHYPLYLSGRGYNRVVTIHGTDRMYWRATPCSVIRRGDWKLIEFFEDDSIRLFNLRTDIGEKTDLALAQPAQAAALLAELKTWQKQTEATIPSRLNPAFDPNKVVTEADKLKEKKKK
jgi:arylsulfatase A-like enzyme